MRYHRKDLKKMCECLAGVLGCKITWFKTLEPDLHYYPDNPGLIQKFDALCDYLNVEVKIGPQIEVVEKQTPPLK